MKLSEKYSLTECRCNISGTVGSIGQCDSKNGQCICKHSVTERTCSQCVDGTYNLQESNLFGCSGMHCPQFSYNEPIYKQFIIFMIIRLQLRHRRVHQPDLQQTVWSMLLSTQSNWTRLQKTFGQPLLPNAPSVPIRSRKW